MKRNFLKVLIVSVLVGGMASASTQVFAQNIGVNNSNSPIILAQNDKLKDGKYDVSVQILKENSEELSMAGQYISKNASLKVENGQTYMTLNFSKINWMKNIKISVNGAEVSYKTIPSGENATITFKVPDIKANIKVRMNVEPMGNVGVAFRVAIQNDIKGLDNKTIAKKPTVEKKQENIAKKPTVEKKSDVEKKAKVQEVKKPEGNKTLEKPQENKSVKEKTNVKEKDDVKKQNLTDNNNQSQEVKQEQKKEQKEEKLPKTGSPITQSGILALGQLTAIAGLLLKKKSNK
ncbi:LPXTG cell wall anchor domain-containing protein [Clostridium tetani]|nr:LPXTG cell wall anchor domain-containing protein [Clostridium tetani]